MYPQENDSLRLYRNLKNAAYKHRLTRLAYDALFVDPEPRGYPEQPAVAGEEKRVNPYLLHRGLIIRRINVTVLDPFGNSVNDTVLDNINLLQKAGNTAHITTRRWIVLNRLLFQENDTVNPLAFSESERLLREAVFVNDARVLINPAAGSDSVDVTVIIHDKWPVTIPLMVTDIAANARLRNTNFIGLGQHFEQYVAVRRPDQYELNGFYSIANIDRSYISSRMSYAHNRQFTHTSLVFDRPFYSPLAKWAGGLALNHTWRKHAYFDSLNQQKKHIPLNLVNYDLYLGKTFKFSKSKSLFNQSTNLVAGARYFNNFFLNRPSPQIDTARAHRNWGGIICNLGFAVQQYYKDKYIYRFGANEDVPEGFVAQFIFGGWKREFGKVRYYNGIEIARARHYDFGYLSGTFSYGVFYNTNVPNDVTTNLRFNYFTDLVRRGDWFFRQFLNFTAVHGENKLSGEVITLRPDEMYGFNNATLTGNTKMLFNSETVAYMPYNVVGFRFAPVLMVGMGMIGSSEDPVARSRVYQSYSLGIMLRNENLLTSTFHVSFGFYPILPDGQTNVFVYNPIGSFSLRVRGFSIGRPDFVSYY